MFKIINNQKGFTIVAALMTLILLIAVSTIVFLVTTKDLRVSTRIIGEKKAFAGAEAGINQLRYYSETHGGNIAGYTATGYAVDGDTIYTISDPLPGSPTSYPDRRYMAGYSITGGQEWRQTVTGKTVTGENTRYQSRIDIDVGIGFGPVDISRSYR